MTSPNVKDEDREWATAWLAEHWPDCPDYFGKCDALATEHARLRERAERLDDAIDALTRALTAADTETVRLLRERDEQAARAETLRAALVACENYLADGDYGEEPDLRDVRDKALAALSATPAASLAALKLRDADRVRVEMEFIIASTVDIEKCDYITLQERTRALDLSALLGIAPPAAQKGETR